MHLHPLAPVRVLTRACSRSYNTETIPTDRHHFNAVVGARDLWETYLPAFEALLVDGQVQSIMCSYNEVRFVAFATLRWGETRP